MNSDEFLIQEMEQVEKENHDAAKLAARYIELRKQRKALLTKYEEIDKTLSSEMDEISKQMLGICNDINANTIRTPNGTISRKTTTRFNTSDWSAFYNMVNQYDAPYLLQKRISDIALAEFLEEHPEAEPPGLIKNVSYQISVRKPS